MTSRSVQAKRIGRRALRVKPPQLGDTDSTDKTPVEVWALRQRIADAYFAGRLQHEIGTEMGVSQVTVSRHLAAIMEEWKMRAVEAFAERQARELARLDNLERVAWRAWQRSCEDSVTTYREVGTENSKEGERRTGQAGDPRFLAQVERCVELRCKLLGMITKRLELEAPRELVKVFIGGDPRELI